MTLEEFKQSKKIIENGFDDIVRESKRLGFLKQGSPHKQLDSQIDTFRHTVKELMKDKLYQLFEGQG